MNNRYFVLGISTFGTIAAAIMSFSVPVGLCYDSDITCVMKFNSYANFLSFFSIILLFSLITLKLKDRVCSSWLYFSYIAGPLGLLASYILSLQLYHGPGHMNFFSNFADLVFYVTLFSIYTIGSVIAIYRGYQKQTVC